MLKGKFISTVQNTSTFCAEKVFNYCGGAAVLKITALGLYFAEINGKRVGDCYLTPGWTSYKKTLQVQEYDVSALLTEGENKIVITAGRGWYCGFSWDRRGAYGEKCAVCADLLLDGETVCTDENWLVRESFIRFSDLYDGETQDFCAPLKRLEICVVPFCKDALVAQISEPVRTAERLSVKEIIITPEGDRVYDFGQNIAGVAEIETPENFEGTVTLNFAEVLVNGNFYTENLRSAKAEDKFTLKGRKILSPEFTFHGFRYMKMSGAELPAESVTALARHTDLQRRGRIQTCNKRFQRLMDNVLWGQRSNFVDIPTDCPQRDERLGWTGDINAFLNSADLNYYVLRFMKKWLADVRNDQTEDGRIPHVVPDVLGNADTSAVWCDCIVLIPWKLYRIYGDKSFLRENFLAMQKFMEAKEKTLKGGVVADGFEYGDWLAIDNEEMFSKSSFGRTDSYFVSNCFYLECLKVMVETCKLLGEKQLARTYTEKRIKFTGAVRREYLTSAGRLAFDTVSAQALALAFKIVPEKHVKKVAKALNENVLKHGCAVVTGFAATPYLLFALADNGYFETAEKVLMNSGCPGWLYEVDMGATTVWERWDSMRPDYTPNPDAMTSFNHYAYGSVQDFIVRRVAGIEPVMAGYRSVLIAPHPVSGIKSLSAEYEAAKGKIYSGYEYADGIITYTFKIPDGVKGNITLPGEPPVILFGGVYEFKRRSRDLGAAPYTPESFVDGVFTNPKAVKAFNKVFGGIFTGSEIAWMKGKAMTLYDMAKFRDGEKKMKLSDFPDMLKRANELFLSE